MGIPHTDSSRGDAPERPWLLASWLGLALLIALVLRFGMDAGIIWDEEYHREYGDRVLDWFGSGFKNDSAMHYSDLYLYGGLFDLFAQLLVRKSSLGPYETRHLVTAFTALLGVVGTWQVAKRIGGVRAGFLAALMLVLTPAWLGHGLFNPKDIPFGAAAVFAVGASVRLAMGPMLPRWRDILLAGLTTGIALAVRPGGMFLLSYPFIAAGARALLTLWRRQQNSEPLAFFSLFAGLCVRALVLVALAWLLMLSTWPWAQLAPIARPFEALRVASNFVWDGEVLFRGENIDAHELPVTYLPVWFAISLPETYLVALACGLGVWLNAVRRRVVQGERALGTALVVTSVALPFAAALLVRPVLYDAQRHFLFLLPPLAALAGIALAQVFGALSAPVWLRALTAAVFVSVALRVGLDIVKLHPYEYVYFNRLSGGLPAAFGRYETDYWGASYKDGLKWVLKKMPLRKGGRPLRVSSCDSNSNTRLRYYVEQWPGAADRVEIVRDYRRADVFLAVMRFHCSEVPGEVLYSVRRQRTPLLHVIRTEHP